MKTVWYMVVVVSCLFLVLAGIANWNRVHADILTTPDKYTSVTVKIETYDGMGSGVYVGDGMILTAGHVIRGNAHVRVTFSNGAEVMGNVVDVGSEWDTALISVKPQPGIAPVLVDCKPLTLGQPIDVLGYPLDLGLVYSPGVVSSVDTAKNPKTDYQIAISALITHGSSGGPVFNTSGKLVGIVDSMVAAKKGPSISLIIPVTDIIPQCTSK